MHETILIIKRMQKSAWCPNSKDYHYMKANIRHCAIFLNGHDVNKIVTGKLQ